MPRRSLVPACALACALICLSWCSRAVAQDDPAKTPPKTEVTTPPPADPKETPPTPAPPTPVTPPPSAQPATTEQPAAKPDAQQAQAAFDAAFAAWKEKFKELRRFESEFQTVDEAGREKTTAQWNQVKADMWVMVPDLIKAGAAAFQAAPNDNRELTNWLGSALEDLVASDHYDEAISLGELLLANECDDAEVFGDTGIANFAVQNFERAAELLDKAIEANALSGNDRALRQSIDECQKLWAAEQETRKKEAEKDDLPRIKLTTSEGEIVLELFENEAPETVGNFISLVKSGFYDGLTFHRVLAGFMAQAGCPEGDGTGGPGYNIYDECKKPEARMHFRGTLSMAKTGAPDTGGSQFFITYRPTPPLNNLHTVFGRVLEGMDVATKLQRRDPTATNPPEPDKILKAEVLRDRGHEYLPRKKVD